MSGERVKKKVLFIMNNLQCGGAEKALISLLEQMDDERYDVHLFLFKHEGALLSSVPERVKLLPEPESYRLFDMPLRKALFHCLRRGKWLLAWHRFVAGFIFKTEKNRVRCEQRVWKHAARSVSKVHGSYDVAVGFLEKNPIYFCVDKVEAEKKIGFIHTDYAEMGMDAQFDRRYFAQLSSLVTVSDECRHVLNDVFPQFTSKINVIYNIVTPTTIRTLAEQRVDDLEGAIQLASVGRLVPIKGYDLAIEACRMLVEDGYFIRWLVIGEGPDRSRLMQLVRAERLESHFMLLGYRQNPYPYVRRAQLYVQPSRYEGKSLAIDEAKILQVPVVATNFRTAATQITHGVNGMIAQMSSESLYLTIKTLLDDDALRWQMSQQLAAEQLDTVSEINKFYKLIG